MDPPNPSAPGPEFTSLEHFLQVQAAEEAAAKAAVAANDNTTADDFPTDPAEQRALNEQFVTAVLNIVDIVDNYRVDPMENSDVKFIHSLPREKLVRKGWEVMYYDYKVQRGIIHPEAFSPEIPNYMTRFRLTLCTLRSSKAACCDLFTLPMIWRYTCNPVRELETKVSNNHTNKLKEYRKPLDQVRKFGGSYETVGNVTYVKKSTGEVIETLTRPQKRPLTDFLDDDLAAYARVKRQRRATGSATSGPSTVNSLNNSNAVASQPVEDATGGGLAPILEEPDDEENVNQEEPADQGDTSDSTKHADGGDSDRDKPTIDGAHGFHDHTSLQGQVLIDQQPDSDCRQQRNIEDHQLVFPGDEDLAPLDFKYSNVDPQLTDN
ncbi:hypothetical protein QBC45DRAFT_392070 [Copromyces sp. CBS 386.78]|nr:hypothetical protein QBC45DRAFT_392070 [Copromyces sp. CBS 386.78]